MLSLLKKLASLLSPREKFICVIFVLMMVVNAFMEMIGIGLIMPVIALLSKPELIQQNKYLKMIYDFLSPESNQQFLVILCFLLMGLYLVKNAFTMFLMWCQSKFIYNKASELGTRLYENYIKTDYSFHLNHNPAHLLYNLNTVLPGITALIVMPLIIIISEIMVVAIITIVLFIANPQILIPLTVFGSLIAWGFHTLLRKYIYNLGVARQKEGKISSQISLQGIKASKECKVLNRENSICRQFSHHRSRLNDILASIHVLNQAPRCVVESFVIIIGLSIMLLLLASGRTGGEVTLSFSLFAISFIRLMPSMTRIQYNLNTIRHSHFAFNEVFNDLTELKPEDKHPDAAPIIFNKHISIENISFSYPASEFPVIADFSLQIPKNAAVAIVGKTGCGKTTLVDIVMGLLKPTSGNITVDDINIFDSLASWQKQIGYVPQFIYLMDDTIEANVAFGIEEAEIDHARVKQCLETAQVWDFVESLPNRLKTIVGDDGIRLSGGQRQRIGIARALYHDPDILILDEATSSLDNETEKAFIDAINTLKGKMTIVMIAHRLTTVENCDEIVNL